VLTLRFVIPPRHWRRAASIGVGLPLLLGSTPAAAAGAGAALFGGLSTWIGVLAAVWAVLGLHQGDAGTAAFATGAAIALVSLLWAWRHRVRAGAPAAALHVRRSGDSAPALPAWPVPVGVDSDALLSEARARFLCLQAAWDDGDVAALSRLTTPEMLEELLDVLTARGSAPNRTDVLTLHAELLGLEELGAAYLASIEFSGLIRESADAGAVPFRELWMLSATKEGAPSWRLARQQALL
jgi:hypothetical protein